LHAHRIAEIAAVTVSPADDPETLQGRRDEQTYRDVLGRAMDAARVDALVFPVWSFPPVLNGDRRQTAQGSLTFVGSATQWWCRSALSASSCPSALQLLGRPWSEGVLIRLGYAYEQTTSHRRPPISAPPLPE